MIQQYLLSTAPVGQSILSNKSTRVLLASKSAFGSQGVRRVVQWHKNCSVVFRLKLMGSKHQLTPTSSSSNNLVYCMCARTETNTNSKKIALLGQP